MNRTVQFTCPTMEQREQMEEYAVKKGFNRVSNLALYSIIRLMNQYPLVPKRKSDGRRRDVHPASSGGNSDRVEKV